MIRILTHSTDCHDITADKEYDAYDERVFDDEIHYNIRDNSGYEILVVVTIGDCEYCGDTIIVPDSAIYSAVPISI